MHPHIKKVVVMAAISLAIIMAAYIVPVYVVPVALGVSQVANCTDYGCANSTFTKCGGFSSSESGSTDFMSSWTRGMKGMLCMIGLKLGTPSNAIFGQVISCGRLH